MKYKELIAVAVVVTTQCPYCIEIHPSEHSRAARSRSGRDQNKLPNSSIRLTPEQFQHNEDQNRAADAAAQNQVEQ